MGEFFWFKLISITLSVAVIWMGIRSLRHSSSKWLWIVSISLFCASTLLFFPEGIFSEWFKHLPFYIGQLTFYFFLKQLINELINQPGSSPTSTIPVLVSTVSLNTVPPLESKPTWIQFLTEQGIQHIITLPLLFSIISLVRVQYYFINSREIKTVLNTFILGAFSLTMIHVGEFIVESQNWIASLAGEPIEIIEFIWYYLGIGCFLWALKQVRQLHLSQQALSRHL